MTFDRIKSIQNPLGRFFNFLVKIKIKIKIKNNLGRLNFDLSILHSPLPSTGIVHLPVTFSDHG